MGSISAAFSDVHASPGASGPWWVVEVTSACNNNCGFCCLNTDGQGAAVHGEESLESRLREGQGGGHDAVAFVGAEPTLNERLPDAIRDAQQMGYSRLLLQTNGRRLAYRSYVNKLVRSGLTHVEVSLQGALNSVHDYHTRAPRSFEHTLGGISAALDCEVTVGVSTVITRSNFRHLPEVAALLDRLNVRHWCLSVVQAVLGAEREFQRLIPSPGMLQSYLGDAIQVADGCGIQTVVRGGLAGLLAETPGTPCKETGPEMFDFVGMHER